MLPKANKCLLLILGAILISRFIPMAIVPLTDSTEARYGEIARLMMETSDWVTPYLNYHIPFWGKPPFAFWTQALSFKIFGVNEFAPRFPSWLATVSTIGLIFGLLNSVFNQHTAILASLIFLSCLLVFVLSGAVLADPFLTLAVTLSLVSFVMVRHEKSKAWRYWFFFGVALGLLSKGPIALVIISGPIGVWLLLSKHRWQVLKLFPWLTGSILTAALTLPWYIAAEIKTPGFIEYFLVGEHFYRFLDPGWAGDLYGSAHEQPKGTIWILWLAASLPWGPIALATVLKQSLSKDSRITMRQRLSDDDISFFCLWAIFPMCFFSLAGNVLWTYALPALPALAILLALYFSRTKKEASSLFLPSMSFGALVIPVSLLAATVYVAQHPDVLPTEKQLVEYYESVATEEDTLFFVGDRSFSARYYSKESAELLTLDELEEQLQRNIDRSLYLAIPKKHARKILQHISTRMILLFENNKYELFKTQPDTTAIYFQSVASCCTATAVSLPCAFSDLSRSNYSKSAARYREGLLVSIDRRCLEAEREDEIPHDFEFHSVLGMLNIDTSARNPELDIFAECGKHSVLASNESVRRTRWEHIFERNPIHLGRASNLKTKYFPSHVRDL